ncbi:MAG TPA: threonylcarbamoyl-AMP synthase [Desulfobacteraceae bacterium]|nr:threonylcarbamoyl-AMP synthase [Desulfobacteraceae bacterium]
MGETEKDRKPRVIRVSSSQSFQGAVKKAAEVLSCGGLVAYPTESFYGLAVDATDEAAIKRLFSIKKRQTSRPVLILIPSENALVKYVIRIPPITQQLIKEFWPGALTLVFEAGPLISPLLTGGTGKIGIRFSSNAVATALTRAMGVPITGTSANISGKPPCLNVTEVLEYFGQGVDLILDDGESKGKIASTVLDITVDPPLILRKGIIDRGRLEKIFQCR